MKNKIKITQELVKMHEHFFIQNLYVNFFSQKYIYTSKNFQLGYIKMNTFIGNLGGVPVNNWKEESEQTTIFIISEKNFEALATGNESNEVAFISALFNKKQTKKDSNENLIISTDLIVIRENIFLEYVASRENLNGKILKTLDTKVLRKATFNLFN